MVPQCSDGRCIRNDLVCDFLGFIYVQPQGVTWLLFLQDCSTFYRRERMGRRARRKELRDDILRAFHRYTYF